MKGYLNAVEALVGFVKGGSGRVQYPTSPTLPPRLHPTPTPPSPLHPTPTQPPPLHPTSTQPPPLHPTSPPTPSPQPRPGKAVPFQNLSARPVLLSQAMGALA